MKCTEVAILWYSSMTIINNWNAPGGADWIGGKIKGDGNQSKPI